MDTLTKIQLARNEDRLSKPNALHALCMNQEIDLVIGLLDRDSTYVNSYNQNGLTPLHVAVISADSPYLEDLINFLLYYGADVNATCIPSGDTALHLAVIYSKLVNAEISVPLLLNQGADPSIRNHAGRTAFDYAINNGYMELAQLLGDVDDIPDLARKINPYNWKYATKKFEEDLEKEIQNGNVEGVITMMKQMRKDSKGHVVTNFIKPLHSAVLLCNNFKLEMIDTLIKMGVNKDELDQYDNTAIQSAILDLPHNDDMLLAIHCLITHRTDKGRINPNKKTALMMAREKQYADVEELLQTDQLPRKGGNNQKPQEAKPKPVPKPQPQPAPKSSQDPNEFTGPYHQLHQLIMQDKKFGVEISKEIEELFNKYPTLDPMLRTKDKLKDTPLHLAARADKGAVMQLLINKGAKVAVRNEINDTPLMLIRRKNYGINKENEDILLTANRKQIAQARMKAVTGHQLAILRMQAKQQTQEPNQ